MQTMWDGLILTGTPAPAQSPPRRGGAADARRSRRPGLEALTTDAVPATLADAVRARAEPVQRPVEVGETVARGLEQRHRLRPLERDRRALGVVLVVGRDQRRRRDDPFD